MTAPHDVVDAYAVGPDGPEAPHDAPEGWAAWAIGALTIVTIVALAALAVWAITALTDLDGAGTAENGRGASEAVIPGGQPPSVAATAGGRIVDVGCVVTGPVPVVPNDSGAFTVVGNVQDVNCPQETFRRGMTLRWPAGSPPETIPRG